MQLHQDFLANSCPLASTVVNTMHMAPSFRYNEKNDLTLIRLHMKQHNMKHCFCNWILQRSHHTRHAKEGRLTETAARDLGGMRTLVGQCFACPPPVEVGSPHCPSQAAHFGKAKIVVMFLIHTPRTPTAAWSPWKHQPTALKRNIPRNLAMSSALMLKGSSCCCLTCSFQKEACCPQVSEKTSCLSLSVVFVNVFLTVA